MLEKFKSPYIAFLTFWLLCIFTFLASKSGPIAAFTIFYTGLLPFIYIVLWVSKSETGMKLRENAKNWHVAIGMSWFVFGYAIYSQKWAAGIINDVFLVDAGNLGITYTLLAFLFTPFGMLYQESIISVLWNTLIVVGMIWGGVFPILLMLPIPFKKVAKIIGGSFLIVALSSFFIGVVSNLALNKESLVQRFALWADFNSNHLCTDDWSKKTESVLFLGGDRVLAYQPQNPEGSQFTPETCNYAKSF